MGNAVDIRGERLAAEQYQANFDDLTPPLDRKLALVEASRCYFCFDAPCINACPTSIDIPSFIRKIQTDNVKGSAMDILGANIMGGACSRVCPTEVLCEEACVRMAQEQKPVKIGLLQRYSTDWLFDNDIQPFTRAADTGRHIAVVGAGPAGLACAHGLARLGHAVTIYEKRPKPGGLNEYGIAAYKVPHEFAQREVDFILAVGGIEVRYAQALGSDVSLAALRRDHDAVFLAVGLGGTNSLGIVFEELEGVIDAVSFIETLRQTDNKASLPVGRDIVVIGGGNTAIDISVQTKRLGAENVTLVYRRGPSQMSATHHEQEIAKLDGVSVKYWARPSKLIADSGHVTAIEFDYTELDDQGRLRVTGDSFVLKADQVFKAIGQTFDTSDGELPDMANGKIGVDEHGATSIAGVWAGGDATPGQDLTVAAVEDGKMAAAAIDRYLQS